MRTRRAFLKAGGLGLVSLSFASGAPGFLGRAALAAPGPAPFGRRKVLVAIFQRGAMDAIMAVPPLEEERLLKKLRPRLFMGAARSGGADRVLDLGNGFGLHPALEPLHRYWQDGRLAVVHAVGSPDPTRSHFDAQDYMETATPGRKGTPSGWLNRVVGELGHEAGSPFQAVSLTAALPRSLYGEEAALAISRLEDFRLRVPGPQRVRERTGQGFEALYAETSQELLRSTGEETFEAMDLITRLEQTGSRRRRGGSPAYPRSPLGRSLEQIAVLIKAELGLEVAFAETGGWDTHVQQGTTGGTFDQRSRELAGALAAFWADLGTYRDDVVVLTMTEFGRTVRENGSGGTDHGHGSCLFLLGNRVAGGRLHGSVPGLDPDLLYEGRDLPVTTDFRSVFAGVVESHLGVRDPTPLFPGWTGEPMSLFRQG